LLWCATAGWPAETIPGDAERGEQLFTAQKCIHCHSVSGKGGKLAPDLGTRAGRDFTPSGLAGMMWNHAPTMCGAMEKAGIEKPAMSPEDASDLFAFFFAARFFDRPGDAARGRRVFVNKGCSGCHGVSSATPSEGRPVSEWESLASPIDLGRQMWNHASQMGASAAKAKKKWPRLTGAELTDMLVYLQNLPGSKRLKGEFSPASAETGKQLFSSKGCAHCHTGSNSLARRREGGRSMNDVVAAMWNHSQSMLQDPPSLNSEEMTRLVGYV